MYFSPSLDGYNQFRTRHSNCVNGLMHTVGFTMAVIGGALVLFSLIKKMFPKSSINVFHLVSNSIFGGLWILYLFYDPIMGTISMVIYSVLINRIMAKLMKIIDFRHLTVGIILLAIPISILESIGHGYIEENHSDILELPNSILQTFLYSIYSLIYPFTGECW